LLGPRNLSTLSYPSLTTPSAIEPVIETMTSEVEEILERIQKIHKGVQGVIVTNNEGITIRSTVSEPTENTENYTQILTEIVERAKAALKDNDELTFLKIRTKKTEFIIVPDKDYILITLFNPSNESTA